MRVQSVSFLRELEWMAAFPDKTAHDVAVMGRRGALRPDRVFFFVL
jgi:hypothetical protein